MWSSVAGLRWGRPRRTLVMVADGGAGPPVPMMPKKETVEGVSCIAGFKPVTLNETSTVCGEFDVPLAVITTEAWGTPPSNDWIGGARRFSMVGASGDPSAAVSHPVISPFG